MISKVRKRTCNEQLGVPTSVVNRRKFDAKRLKPFQIFFPSIPKAIMPGTLNKKRLFLVRNSLRKNRQIFFSEILQRDL